VRKWISFSRSQLRVETRLFHECVLLTEVPREHRLLARKPASDRFPVPQEERGAGRKCGGITALRRHYSDDSDGCASVYVLEHSKTASNRTPLCRCPLFHRFPQGKLTVI
jgi:hypothetical protein